MTASVIVVEDHPLYRDALTQLLRTSLKLPRIAAMSTVEEALDATSKGQDVALVLLDISLPGLSGAEAVRTLGRAHPSAEIVVISASEDDRDVNAAIRAGALAFVSKTVPPERIGQIVERILRRKLHHPVWVTPQGESSASGDAMPRLTPRQKQIVRLLCRGDSNKAIASSLGLAEVTVRQHVSGLLKILEAENRTQAVLVARRLGLCQSDSNRTHSRRRVSGG